MDAPDAFGRAAGPAEAESLRDTEASLCLTDVAFDSSVIPDAVIGVLHGQRLEVGLSVVSELIVIVEQLADENAQ